MGQGISYTETKFIEDKWAEWTENNSKLVPTNIKTRIITTLVFDNIDWENKNVHGNETHNTFLTLRKIRAQIYGPNLGQTAPVLKNRSMVRYFTYFEETKSGKSVIGGHFPAGPDYVTDYSR